MKSSPEGIELSRGSSLQNYKLKVDNEIVAENDIKDKTNMEFEMNKILNELLISRRDNKLLSNPSSNNISEFVTKYINDGK